MSAESSNVRQLEKRPPLLEVLSQFGKDAYRLRNQVGVAVFGTPDRVYATFGTGYEIAKYLRGLTVSKELQPLGITVLPSEIISSHDAGGIENYLTDALGTKLKVQIQDRQLQVYKVELAPSEI